ncbi:MAG: ankyrin repeat domain-containing protein, partial [Alphaproteobacteria bacterium]
MALCLGAAVVIGAPRAQAQDSGAGALFAAIQANDLDAVKQIVASGADPRARDANGLSAPQAAVRLGHHVIAHYLLAYRRPKIDPPLDQAINQALDRAVAETEKTAGPIPEAAPPQTEAADAPVTLPEPAPAVDVADRREPPPVPPHDQNTKT